MFIIKGNLLDIYCLLVWTLNLHILVQSLLRGRFLRNERPAEEERPPSVAASELVQLRQRHTISGLRLEALQSFLAWETIQFFFIIMNSLFVCLCVFFLTHLNFVLIFLTLLWGPCFSFVQCGLYWNFREGCAFFIDERNLSKLWL